jgi:hypothetical protein
MRRTLIALALCSLFIPSALADTSGPNNPGTLADDGSNGGSQTWSSPANAAASDDAYASVPCECNKVGFTLVHDLTHYLKATGFGFSVPSDATIDSITVEIERHAGGFPSSIADGTVSLVVGSSVQGSNQASPVTWPATDLYAQYGPMSWGLSLTPANVNASNFGVVIAAIDTAGVGQCPNAGVAFIDHIWLTVVYTPAPPPPKGMPRRMIHISRSSERIESTYWRSK